MALGGLLLLAILAIAVLVGLCFSENRAEDSLLWKLAAYGILGLFTVSINGLRFPLPVGYALALILAGRAGANRTARLVAATTTFVLWLISPLIH